MWRMVNHGIKDSDKSTPTMNIDGDKQTQCPQKLATQTKERVIVIINSRDIKISYSISYTIPRRMYVLRKK